MNTSERIHFLIPGNQEDLEGNAIPYTRTTQGSKWSPKYQRYGAWKNYVIKHSKLKEGFDKKGKLLKPIAIPDGYKAVMNLRVFYTDNTHPDTDNVFKGIADALFQNDKRLAGSFDFWVKPKAGGIVEVEIFLIKIEMPS